MSTFLSAAEISQLTARRQSRAQRMALNHMGVMHKTRPDGTLVVARAHVESLLGINAPSKASREAEPDLSWM